MEDFNIYDQIWNVTLKVRILFQNLFQPIVICVALRKANTLPFFVGDFSRTLVLIKGAGCFLIPLCGHSIIAITNSE
mgnify:CR=1 FL=1